MTKMSESERSVEIIKRGQNLPEKKKQEFNELLLCLVDHDYTTKQINDELEKYLESL